MFADPQTITLSGSGGTALNLVRINQDNYGSEFFLQHSGGLSEYRMKIRHLHKTVKAGQNAVDRHNVEIAQYVYPTTLVPLGRRRLAYTVFENEVGDNLTEVNDFVTSLPFWMTEAFSLKLLAWES